MMMAFPDYATVVFRMHWAMGIVWLAIFIAVVIFLVWVAFKLLIWRAARKRAERKARKIRYRPDGQPYPPAGEGVCDRCERAHQKVYYMSSGRRLCPSCYEVVYMSAGPQRPRAGAAADRAE